MGQQPVWMVIALVLDAVIAEGYRFGTVAVAAALALPDLGAAVKRVVRLLLEHSGDGLTDDVALVLASSRDNVT
jgi:hypothetical protein